MKTVSLSLVFDFPVALGKYSIFDIGQGRPYIDEMASVKWFARAYKENIKNELNSLFDLCEKGKYKIATYFSGHFLSMLQKIDEKQVKKLKALILNGEVEILGGTVNHSLSSVYSPICFEWEVIAHLDIMNRVLGAKPTKFYNTENLYFDGIVPELIKLGFDSTMAGVVKWYLGDNSTGRIFRPSKFENFTLFLIDAEEQGLLFESNEQSHHNLQFDLETLKTLGGIAEVVKKISKIGKTVTLQGLSKTKNLPSYKVKSPTMGSIHGRSISSYNGEAMQRNALNQFYDLGEIIEKSQYEDFMKAHAELGKSDIFLQLSKTSSLNQDPFNTYSQYINMLTDLEIRLGRK